MKLVALRCSILLLLVTIYSNSSAGMLNDLVNEYGLKAVVETLKKEGDGRLYLPVRGGLKLKQKPRYDLVSLDSLRADLVRLGISEQLIVRKLVLLLIF